MKYENDKFITESIVTENKNTPDGYGLYLTVNRPEGIPQYQMVVSNKDVSATYSIQYDGKEGTPPSGWILPQKGDEVDFIQTTTKYKLTKNVYKDKNVTVVSNI